jgi:hypothetical protein
VGEVLALPHREADITRRALIAALPPRIVPSPMSPAWPTKRLAVALLQALASRARRISLARTQAVFSASSISA